MRERTTAQVLSALQKEAEPNKLTQLYGDCMPLQFSAPPIQGRVRLYDDPVS
jgi:hypothetical protein